MSQARLHIGEILREDFHSEYSVARNGGNIIGNPSVSDGLVSDGSGDGVNYPGFHWQNIQSFSFFMKVKSANSFTNKVLFGSSATGGPLLRHASASSIAFWNDTGAVTSLYSHDALEAGEAYTVGLSYDDATRAATLFVNGVKIATNTLAQSLNGVGVFEAAIRFSSLDSFDGELEAFSVYNRVLSDAEQVELHNGDELSYNNNLKVNLPLDNFLGSERPFHTEETVMGVAGCAQLGDGSSSSTEPTKLKDVNGYSFDGGDRIVIPDCENNQFQGAFSLMLVVSGQMPAANRGILTKNVGSTVLTTPANTVYEISHLSSGLLYFQRSNGATKNFVNTPASNIFDGNVHILFVTYDGETNADSMKIYRDNGELLSSGAATFVGQQMTTDPLVIGWSNLGGAEGNIHTVKGFDKALTVTDMKDIYRNLTNYLHN